MDQTFLKAFAEVVKEQVSQKNSVQLEGLGVFQLKHQKQYQQQFDNGRVVMMPPKDQIVFKEDT